MSKTTLIDSRIRKYAYREISQIYQDIGASPDGLSHEQVEAMREKYGANSFTERKNDTMIRRLRRAFINPFNIILFILGIISLVTDVFLVSNFARNATTAIIIFSMILISGAIRLIQERMKELGYYYSEPSTTFDEEMQSGLAEFQYRVGLIASGEVNEDTLEALYAPDAEPRF